LGALVEVLEVRLAEAGSEELRGRFLDLPRVGMGCEARALNVVGWVLERGGPAVAVDIVRDGTAVHRVPVEVLRPDLAAGFPDIPSAGRAGFNATLDVRGPNPELRIDLHALLRDGRHIPLAAIHGRRSWRGRPVPPGTELVSIIIVAPPGGSSLQASIESAIGQTHAHVEIVVVGDPGSLGTVPPSLLERGIQLVAQEDAGSVAARNTGLRSTTGDFLVFLESGWRLLPDAVASGLAVLRELRHCAATFGKCRPTETWSTRGAPARPKDPLSVRSSTAPFAPGTVMYRRAVFELIGPFPPGGGEETAMRQISRRFAVQGHDGVVAEGGAGDTAPTSGNSNRADSPSAALARSG
jgi:hypothetical protein